MGHENAGWVEAVGRGVEGVRVGDAVICHLLVTSGHCLACRRGGDMHSADSRFPGINADGGYAEYLLSGERSLIKLPKSLSPKDVAPYTNAGLTAYRAAKKTSRHLLPGQLAVVVGAGGLGHVGIQVLRALCAAEIIVIDRSAAALELAKQCGADHTVLADEGMSDSVMALTGGHGAEAVIDFVGEGNSVAKGIAMTCNGGAHYIAGYGGKIDLPTIDMITSEKSIVGNLVGTYPELVELMALADRGLVNLSTREYRLADANQAQVHASEHFCEGIKRWTCAAAPVYDPGTGAVLGVVDISGPPVTYQRSNLALAVTIARQIEAAIAERAAHDRAQLLEVCLQRMSQSDTAGLLAIDRNGRLVHTTGRLPVPVGLGQRVPGLDANLAVEDCGGPAAGRMAARMVHPGAVRRADDRRRAGGPGPAPHRRLAGRDAGVGGRPEPQRLLRRDRPQRADDRDDRACPPTGAPPRSRADRGRDRRRQGAGCPGHARRGRRASSVHHLQLRRGLEGAGGRGPVRICPRRLHRRHE